MCNSSASTFRKIQIAMIRSKNTMFYYKNKTNTDQINSYVFISKIVAIKYINNPEKPC